MSYFIKFKEKELPVILGVPLTGFGLRFQTSQGVHDNPMVKCLIINDSEKNVVLVHCDLLGYTSERCAKIRSNVAEKLDISNDEIIITCTHTHSGPASIKLIGCGNESDEWHTAAEKVITDCILEAYAKEAKEVSPKLYKKEIHGVSYNRVVNSKDMIDKDILTLVFSNTDDGKVNTVLTNFSCHPVTTREENYLYSRDYPFYVERTIKESFGEDVNFIFANGCCGDTNPVEGDMSGFAATERTGRAIGTASAGSVCEECELPLSGDGLKVYSYDIDFPIERKDDEEFLTQFTEVTHTLIKNAKTPELRDFYPSFFEWINITRERRENGTAEEFYKATVRRVCIGDLNLVFIPFETFHAIGKSIKALLGEDKTIVIELGGGNFGYMPSEALYDRASYERGQAFMGYDHPGPITRKAEHMIYDALKRDM